MSAMEKSDSPEVAKKQANKAVLAIVLLGVPVARILHPAGRSRWWTLIAFIPLLNLIGLWVFAFSRWPTVDRS
jgi:uncharacterized membrane protein YhaH (DUF805 family)